MKHLSMFTGTLQANGYAGYDQVYEDGRNSRSWVYRARSPQVLRSIRCSQVYRCNLKNRNLCTAYRTNCVEAKRNIDVSLAIPLGVVIFAIFFLLS